MSLHEQRDRAQRAKNLLENELLKDALEKMENEIIDAWKNSEGNDERGRYNAYLMYRLLQNFKGQFTQMVTTGEFASHELLQTEKESKIKSFFK